MGCASSKELHVKKTVRTKRTSDLSEGVRTSITIQDLSDRSYSNRELYYRKAVPTAMAMTPTGEVSVSSSSHSRTSSRRSHQSHRRTTSAGGGDEHSQRSATSERGVSDRSAASIQFDCSGLTLAEALDQLEDEDFTSHSSASYSSYNDELDPDVCIVKMACSNAGNCSKSRHSRKRQRERAKDKTQFVMLRQSSVRKEAMDAVTKDTKDTKQTTSSKATDKQRSDRRRSQNTARSDQKTKPNTTTTRSSTTRTSPTNTRRRASKGQLQRKDDAKTSPPIQQLLSKQDSCTSIGDSFRKSVLPKSSDHHLNRFSSRQLSSMHNSGITLFEDSSEFLR